MLNITKNNLKLFNLNKIKVFQITLVLIFLLFLIFLLKAKNYTKTYTINDIEIKEEYNKKTKAYYFTFKYQDHTLDTLFTSSYKQNRKFIEDIKVLKDDDNNFCLVPKGQTFNFYPVCLQNNEPAFYNNVSKDIKSSLDSNLFPNNKLITTYNDIEIYNNNYHYYIWNYNGFYYLNNIENTKIKIFEKELYTINLIGYTKNYLVIADFDSNYTFNNFYTLELKNGKLKKYELDRDIYFDSYYPGFIKNKLYIIDNKEPAMYEFNAKNGKLEKISSKIYQNGKWHKKNIKNLIANKTMFQEYSNYNYLLENNNLYLNYHTKLNTLVSKNVKSIIKISNEDIFYLKDDKLYHFNPTKGEELLLSYFEWNFNYNNMIYLEFPN